MNELWVCAIAWSDLGSVMLNVLNLNLRQLHAQAWCSLKKFKNKLNHVYTRAHTWTHNY